MPETNRSPSLRDADFVSVDDCGGDYGLRMKNHRRDYFDIVLGTLCRHPAAVLLSMLGLALLAGFGMRRIPFEGGLEIMLPEGSEARRSILFLRDSDFADKVAFSVSAVAPSDLSLPEVMESLAGQFDKSPLIRRVVRMPDLRGMIDDALFFLDHFDQLARPEDLRLMAERLQVSEAEQIMRQNYLQLIRPEGSFVQQIVRRDPLRVGSAVLQRIRFLTESFGYHVTLQDGHLMHPEDEVGLLLLETTVPITDTVGARKLVDYLHRTESAMPAGFQGEFVAGHQRSVSNENLLRRDVQVTVTLATLAFLLMFLLVFRDFRAGLIFFIPGISILLAIHFSSWIFGQLSYLVIGFGAVMAGIAVDYGIHVYVALRRRELAPLTAVRGLLRPAMISGLTTLSVFLAFLASAIPGYRQLAGFAVISIGLSIAGAILLLPPLLVMGRGGIEGGRESEPQASEKEKSPRGDFAGLHPKFVGNDARSRVWTVLFWLSLLVAAWFARQVRIDTDIARLDGTEAHVLEAEQQFQRRWSEHERQQAMAVVAGATYEEAAQVSDKLYRLARIQLPEDQFVSLSSVWPSAAERARNRQRWQLFWTTSRVELARRLILNAAEPYGFSAAAFDPFFSLLNAEEEEQSEELPEPGRGEEVDNVILQQLQARFVQTSQGQVFLISFFADQPDTLAAVATAMAAIPDGFIVSMDRLTEAMTAATAREARVISLLALCLILAVVLGLMRNLRMALSALLPAAAGVLWLLAAMRLTGMAVNMANMIAGIVVLGLSIDYGVFMVYGWRSGQPLFASVRQAVTLSAVSTVMGTAALLLARHPALFSIGLTLTVGVSVSFLAAVLGVPGSCRLLGVKKIAETVQS